MNVVFVTPELSPFAKVGGLADVTASLPRALRELGVSITIVLPLYGGIRRDRLRPVEAAVELEFDGRARKALIHRSELGGVPVFFLESDEYFSSRSVYGDENGDFADNAFRFAFFSRAALEAIDVLELDPGVVHVHDWPTALVPVYQRALGMERRPVVLTVHNLAYQGVFPPEWLPRLGIPGEFFGVEGLEFYGKINFLKGGLTSADFVTTVSPTYASEIQTAELGAGLDGVIRARNGVVTGIRNGIDPTDWNPAADRALVAPYRPGELEGKEKNKLALQAELGLEVSAGTPLVGVIGRLDRQKGFDLLLEVAPRLVAEGAQLVVLGSGDRELLRAFERLARAHPRAVAARSGFQDELGRRIYAGSDLFAMPSRYEPCGLGQLIALRYGTIPVVRATGGLADTIRDLDFDRKRGNGFVFREFEPRALLSALGRALACYRDEKAWKGFVKRAMRADFSWGESAKSYASLYRRAVR